MSRGTKRSRLAKALKARKTMRTIASLIGATAFLEQITQKDRDSYSSLDMMHKAMAVGNNVTGRIFNFNLFNGVPKFSQQINPAGIANKWTGIGLALIIAKIANHYSPVKVPMLGKVAGLGKYLLPAGIFGGLFDQPDSGYTTNQPANKYGNGQASMIRAGSTT